MCLLAFAELMFSMRACVFGLYIFLANGAVANALVVDGWLILYLWDDSWAVLNNDISGNSRASVMAVFGERQRRSMCNVRTHRTARMGNL